ncbi:MAG TPA: response regulator [Stellaceae bacterium]|jgi:DNA-binding response OmpR family regulator|nr:response regulator [Stellaceae bacterium]
MSSILLVDDDPLLRTLVEHKLRLRGFEVISAESGEEGLKQASARRPDVIVLDAMLPELDGFEVLQRLQEDAATQSIPVIMLTARKQETDIVSALSKGARDYLVKPFLPEELVMRIRNLLPAP